MSLVHTGKSLPREVHQVPRARALRDAQWRQNRNPHDPRAQACYTAFGYCFAAARARGHVILAQTVGLFGREPRRATTRAVSTLPPPVHEAWNAPAAPKSTGHVWWLYGARSRKD